MKPSKTGTHFVETNKYKTQREETEPGITLAKTSLPKLFFAFQCKPLSSNFSLISSPEQLNIYMKSLTNQSGPNVYD